METEIRNAKAYEAIILKSLGVKITKEQEREIDRIKEEHDSARDNRQSY